MNTQRSMCSIHHVVELLPGMWKLDRLASRSPDNNNTFKEAECPTCLQIVREAFQRQFPTLYAAPMLSSRKSA